MHEDGDREPREEYEDISERERLVRERSPPYIRAECGREEMRDDTGEWSPYPRREPEVSEREIEEILDEDESEDDEDREEDDIRSGKPEILTHESDAHEVLRWLLDERGDEEWNDRGDNHTRSREISRGERGSDEEDSDHRDIGRGKMLEDSLGKHRTPSDEEKHHQTHDDDKNTLSDDE